MKKAFARFLKDESGATAIEYGLIAALISITIITAATNIGGDIKSKFESVDTSLG
ncbi:MAG: Flp family type IVb pilin [Pseudomonadota bacterium]